MDCLRSFLNLVQTLATATPPQQFWSQSWLGWAKRTARHEEWILLNFGSVARGSLRIWASSRWERTPVYTCIHQYCSWLAPLGQLLHFLSFCETFWRIMVRPATEEMLSKLIYVKWCAEPSDVRCKMGMHRFCWWWNSFLPFGLVNLSLFGDFEHHLPIYAISVGEYISNSWVMWNIGISHVFTCFLHKISRWSQEFPRITPCSLYSSTTSLRFWLPTFVQ